MNHFWPPFAFLCSVFVQTNRQWNGGKFILLLFIFRFPASCVKPKQHITRKGKIIVCIMKGNSRVGRNQVANMKAKQKIFFSSRDYHTITKSWKLKKKITKYRIVNLARTSDWVVLKRLDTNGSANARRPLEFVNSIRQSHCPSSSVTFVAVRMITFRHSIYNKKHQFDVSNSKDFVRENK